NPTRFSNNIGNTSIFGFSTGTGESRLPFGRPRDNTVTEKNTVTRCRASGVRTSTSISVSVGDKLCNGGW
ncbi:hypothetical protein A2U01_0092909, partial [Trifolium medium]|nr:hypothetical protein [Trifolium medium]